MPSEEETKEIQTLQAFSDTNNHPTKEDNYESSELSDLGDDQSEAETDKMDFLEDEGAENVLDLNALSKLTELARMKEIDSEEEGEGEKEEERPEEEEKPEQSQRDDSGGDREGDDNEREENQKDEESNKDESHKDESQKDESQKDENQNKHSDNESHHSQSDTAVNKRANGHTEEPRKRLKTEPDENGSQTEHPENSSNEEHRNEEHINEEPSNEESQTDAQADAQADAHPETHPETTATAEAEDNDEDDEDNDNDDINLNEQRKLAIDDLILIEKSFAELRDKLYYDKLTFLEHELQLCLEGSHPELSKVYCKINNFYEDSIRLANSTLSYKLKCINNETIATRTAIHQDFIRKIFDRKNDMILETTSKWYKINKERNKLDQLVPDYSYCAIPTIHPPSEDSMIMNGYVEEPTSVSKKSLKNNTIIELVHQRNSADHQLGVLNGLIQFHGIPSAVSSDPLEPNDQELLLKKASDEEVADDFAAMGIPI